MIDRQAGRDAPCEFLDKIRRYWFLAGTIIIDAVQLPGPYALKGIFAGNRESFSQKLWMIVIERLRQIPKPGVSSYRFGDFATAENDLNALGSGPIKYLARVIVE